MNGYSSGYTSSVYYHYHYYVPCCSRRGGKRVTMTTTTPPTTTTTAAVPSISWTVAVTCCVVFTMFLAVTGVSGLTGLDSSHMAGRCEPVTIPMCLDMRYNMTRMPNLVGHSNQKDAAIQVHEFIPLVQIGCSRFLKFFLCSLYAPMCTELVDSEALIIMACRSMCLEVKSKCEPILQRFNFPWPSMLACENLPEKSDARNKLCMEAPSVTDEPEFDAGTLGGALDDNVEWRKLFAEFNIK